MFGSVYFASSRKINARHSAETTASHSEEGQIMDMQDTLAGTFSTGARGRQL